MKWTSLPRHTPQWILRHPVLLAEWLATRNALRRAMMRRRSWPVAVIALLLGATAFAVAGPLAGHAADVVSALSDYWVAILIVSAVYAAVTVAGRQRASRRQFASSWLAAAPIDHFSEAASHATRSLLPLLLQAVVVMVVLGVLAYLSDAPGSAMKIEACIGAGAICGAAVGWWLLRTRDAEHAVGSRYVFRARTNVQPRPSDAALSTWPIAQLMAWSRPENTRVLLLAALFAVQGGSSALHGLAVVASWFAASYLGGLLSASLRTIDEAAAWLRSTPLPFVRFAWSISRRALLHQVVGAVLAGFLLVAVGASWTMASYLAALWLVIVTVASAAALADCYRGNSPTLSIAISLAALAAIESRARGWSIACAALMTAWHLRRGARALP